ncbi:MAG: hypothetical protein EOP09_03760 [Proteobacteria bacterium]|nr:MAG: hypothetical protein EOP09_03760 [Pseudomonadota bacterium]
MDMNSNRRLFMKRGLVALGSLFVLKGTLLSAFAAEKKAAPAAGPAPLPAGQIEVPAKDAVAGAIGYKGDPKDIDKKKYPQYKPEQKCSNCALYTPIDGKNWGSCQMLAGKGLVNGNGWCGSYSKKA